MNCIQYMQQAAGGDELSDVIASGDVNSIFTFVEKKYPTLSKLMLIWLTREVMMAWIDGEVGRVDLNVDSIHNFGMIVLKKYLDDAEESEKELEALFGLQALVSQLGHSDKLLHNVFEVVFYVCDLISEVVSLVTLVLQL